jgi:cytochrome P450
MKAPIQLDRAVFPDIPREHADHRYADYADLRRIGGVVRDASGMLLVTRHREISQIVSNPCFAFVGTKAFPTAEPAVVARLDAAGFFDLLMFCSGTAHRQARRVLSELFSVDRLSRIRTVVESKAAELLQQLGLSEPWTSSPPSGRYCPSTCSRRCLASRSTRYDP